MIAEKKLRPHPTRDGILDLLRASDKPLSPTQMAETLGTTLGSTAYHVRTLEKLNAVVLVDEARVRGAVEHFYELGPVELSDPVQTILGLCQSLTVRAADSTRPVNVPRDDELREELVQMVEKLTPRVQAAARRALARHKKNAAAVAA